MCSRSFRLWFDVNQCTFEENMCDKRFYIPVTSDSLTLTFDLYISNSLPYSYSFPALCFHLAIKVYTAFIFPENRRHETDGQTDGRGATLNAVPIAPKSQFSDWVSGRTEFTVSEPDSSATERVTRRCRTASSQDKSDEIMDSRYKCMCTG